MWLCIGGVNCGRALERKEVIYSYFATVIVIAALESVKLDPV